MGNKVLIVSIVSGIFLLNPVSSTGQNINGAEKKKNMLHETQDDKYLPNLYQNKKTSPAYKYNSQQATQQSKIKESHLLKSTGTSIFTIQVNVNSSGQNIIGDAANEPNIAVNPMDENKMVIGWRQFDNVTSNFRQAGWAYTTNAGQAWTFPGVLNPGLFRSDPVLDYDTIGNFYYNSSPQDFTCQVFKSTNGAISWDTGTSAGGGDKQWMTIDRTNGAGGGNIYSSWSSAYTTCNPGFFTRSTDDDVSYESCTVVDGDPYWVTMAVGNAGELYIAGADALSGIVVSKSLNAKIAGSTITWDTVPVFMDGDLNMSLQINPVGLVGQANIDVDRSNGPGRDNVYVMASVSRLSNADMADVMFARSTDGGLTWSAPIQINDDASEFNYQWLGTMSVAPNGRIDAVWLDTRDDSTFTDLSALYYSYSIDQGNTWSVNEKLSDSFDPHIGYPNQNKMGDYFDMISDNTGAHLAWANTLNGEEDVYYSHIVPPVSIGINEIAHSQSISISPNPNSGLFFIKSEIKSAQATLYNTIGEKIFSTSISKTISEIDISSQPSGIYFLKIVCSDGSSIVRKIVRE